MTIQDVLKWCMNLSNFKGRIVSLINQLTTNTSSQSSYQPKDILLLTIIQKTILWIGQRPIIKKYVYIVFKK